MRTRTSGQHGLYVWAVVALMAASAPAVAASRKPDKKKRADPTPQVVKITTEDDVEVEADYYEPKVKDGGRAPVAILIHMYPADRSSWKPLVPSLIKSGFAVLAYDIRGSGGSKEPARLKLKQCYIAKDPEHFNDAHRDAQAAKDWLGSQPNCDTSRTVLIGASIGSSIALHQGSQDPDVKAIVCLSPGTDYFGVDSISHIAACGEKPILLIAPEKEYRRVKKLLKASTGNAKGKEYDGKRHGTDLFKGDDGKKVMRKITTFLKRAMPKEEKGEAGLPHTPKQQKRSRPRGI